METRNREKLPKWARNEIERLERDLAYAKAHLMEGPEDSRVFANPYSDLTRKPLGDADILFEFGDHKKIIVKLTDEGIEVYGSSSLSSSLQIQPRASNVVRIKLGEYF